MFDSTVTSERRRSHRKICDNYGADVLAEYIKGEIFRHNLNVRNSILRPDSPKSCKVSARFLQGFDQIARFCKVFDSDVSQNPMNPIPMTLCVFTLFTPLQQGGIDLA